MEDDKNHDVSPGAEPPGSPGNGDVELRTSSGVTIGWVAIAAAVVVAALVVLQVPPSTAVSMLGLPAFIAVLGWSCYLRPRVLLREDGMRVVNILRTYDVPFSRITDIDLRLGVTLETDTGKKIGVWSLPNAGRRARREGLSRGVVEPHIASEVDRVVAAHARWQAAGPAGGHGTPGPGHEAGSEHSSDAAPRRSGGMIEARVQALPVTLCAITVLWALWGLGFSSAL